MIRPPPDAFESATTLRTRQQGRRLAIPAGIIAWTVAAVITIGLHLGIYFALMRKDATSLPVPVEPPAAVMINLSPIAVSARSEVDNTQDGPPAIKTEQAEAQIEEAPPPPAPEPIVNVPPPPPDVAPQAALPPAPPKQEVKRPEKPPEKPVKEAEKKDKPKKPVTPQKKKGVASKSGGGPKSDVQTANVSAAAAAGSAVSEASRASWNNEVRSKIVRAKRFPTEARGQTGVAVVSVTFGSNGSASGVRLVISSGNSALDAEAVAVMYRAAPYPPPPGNKTTMLTVPLNFRR